METGHERNRLPDWDPYLDVLRGIPFVDRAEIRALEVGGPRMRADARLVVSAGGKEYPLEVEFKTTPRINRAMAERVFDMQRRDSTKRWLLVAPHITTLMGRLLAEHGINYVDAAGNARLVLGRNMLAHVEGKRPATRPRGGRGIGAPGYRGIFAILARPELVGAPVREIAARAGLGKTTVADMLERLEGEGVVFGREHGRKLARFGALFDRWIVGYGDVLRPQQLLGRFRTPWTPAELEHRIEADVDMQRDSGPDWAWGGGAACHRLTGSYRGDQTVVHADRISREVLGRLKAVPARDGELAIVKPPGPIAFEGAVAGTAHPLLIHAELTVMRDERADEAAEKIYQRFLGLPR